MKKTLFVGVLLASQLCSAQRILERTTNSWNVQDHSIETYSDWVISGCTDIHPASARMTPMFKRTIFNGVPINSFWLDFPDEVYLMDFTVRPATSTTVPSIILVGMTASNVATMPYYMVVAEVDMNGTVLQSTRYLVAGNLSMIPQQVIFSQVTGQVVVVGTKANGIFPPGAVPEPTPKSGFIVGFNIGGLGVAFSYETNTPATAAADNDMLESVCEIPGVGYFATGSANNNGEQNLYNMGINYSGGLLHSNIYDNTNYHYMGASVISRVNASGQQGAIVLANNSSTSTFEIAGFNGSNGAILTPFYRYPIASLPVGSGINVNGFRLMLDPSNQVFVGGYIHAPTGILPNRLTPFLMVLSPNLATFVSGKTYQSDNNSTLSNYFDESGNSVYVNTPDVFTYVPKTKTTHMINPNTINQGYDVSKSSPYQASQCEMKFPTNSSNNVPPNIGPAQQTFLQVSPTTYPATTLNRPINETTLCIYAALAPSNNTGSAASSVFSTHAISPNPATDKISVEMEEAIREISVIDMNGNSVLMVSSSEKSETSMEIDINELVPGVYMLSITDQEGIIHREKFIKQ